MKVKKKFTFEGLNFQIVEREETYLNSEDTMKMLRVIAPNGGIIPIQIMHRETLKSIAAKAINFLTDCMKRGADIHAECS